MAVDPTLLARIASNLRVSRRSVAPRPAEEAPTSKGAPPTRDKDSILARAAELYSVRPSTEDTPPTGFDPAAAALFEALVEGAYLVAHADGEFDADERAAFEQVVIAATDGHVDGGQLGALLADLDDLLREDGISKRVKLVTQTVQKPEQQVEVLRVAALIASISGGVSDVERATMVELANGFGLNAEAVDRALADATSVLGG
ncbi:MAG: TerB family tellurite resistance protein [Polyangiaceae bacterium]